MPRASSPRRSRARSCSCTRAIDTSSPTRASRTTTRAPPLCSSNACSPSSPASSSCGSSPPASFGQRLRGALRTRAAAVVLCQPLRELPLWGVEVTAETVLEPGNLVAKLDEPVLEAALGITDVTVSLVGAERSTALFAWHVVGVGEGAGHAVLGNTYFALVPAVPSRMRERAALLATLSLRPVARDLGSCRFGDGSELDEHAQRVP